MHQKLQWNTSIYACSTSLGSSFKLTTNRLKGILSKTLSVTSFHSSFLILYSIFKLYIYFFLFIKLPHIQAIQEYKQDDTEIGNGHAQVFQEWLILHHTRHYIPQHGNIYQLTNSVCLIKTSGSLIYYNFAT